MPPGAPVEQAHLPEREEVAQLAIIAAMPVMEVGNVRVRVFGGGVLVPVGVPDSDRKVGMGVPMVAVVVAVAVGVAERFVGVRVRVAVERQQCDGSHEERAGKKL